MRDVFFLFDSELVLVMLVHQLYVICNTPNKNLINIKYYHEWCSPDIFQGVDQRFNFLLFKPVALT